MVQENSIFGHCCENFIDGINKNNDHCGTSKIDSSHSMEGGVVNASSVEDEEMDEEWKRRKRDELIEYYIRRHEDRLKNINPNVCVHANKDWYYYLVPRRKRSKRKSSSRVESLLKTKNKKSKMILREKPIKKSLMTVEFKETIQEFGASEVAIPMEEDQGVVKIESFLKNVRRDLRSINKCLITTIEKEGTPRIESFLKSEKRKKMIPNTKPNKVSQAILPMELKNKIQELGVPISEVSLVIEKSLFPTDLSGQHMRLSIPLRQVLNHEEFLTTQEKEILDTKDSSGSWSQIKFNLIEPSLEKCSIHLAKWPMNSSSCYMLLNDWMSVNKRNNLKVDMKIQLWSFRNNSNRWLALVVVPPAPNGKASDDMMQIKSEN